MRERGEGEKTLASAEKPESAVRPRAEARFWFLLLSA